VRPDKFIKKLSEAVNVLVYASELTLIPKRGRTEIFEQIARWLGSRFGERGSTYIDPEKLQLGVRELRAGRDQLSSFTSSRDANATEWMHCVQFVHPDESVTGRTWTTEVGVYQKSGSREVHCSFVVRADEASTTVQAPVTVSRPKIVLQLFQNCGPTSEAPGHAIKKLRSDAESLSAFVAELERRERRHPMVLVSRDNVTALTAVDVNKLRELLVGLAQVVELDRDADTWEVERAVGRQRSAFDGAINILFPAVNQSRFVPSYRILADVLREKGIQHVLACVTHRTNIPRSLNHFSASKVQTLSFRERVRNLASPSDQAPSASAIEEYRALLDDAELSLRAKDEDIRTQNDLLRIQDGEIDEYKSQVFSLQTRVESLEDTSKQLGLTTIEPILKAFESCAQSGKVRLKDCVQIISAIYGDRVRFLPSAYASAERSDEFRYANKAFELLSNLAGPYWDALAAGKPDSEAKTVLGNNDYAQNEGEALGSDGRARRTFDVDGVPTYMQKHLKHGVKESVAETLRIHFEWFADRKQIVVGHCGKHLDR
jgi:hypothetical protein